MIGPTRALRRRRHRLTSASAGNNTTFAPVISDQALAKQAEISRAATERFEGEMLSLQDHYAAVRQHAGWLRLDRACRDRPAANPAAQGASGADGAAPLA